MMALLPLALILSVFTIIFWRFYTKAGKPGWVCIVPFYNLIVLSDIAKVSRSKAWSVIATWLTGWVVGVVTTYVGVSTGSQLFLAVGSIAFYGSALLVLALIFPIYKGVAINFGKPASFTWGLLFLNVIFFAILGFGSARYQGGSYLNDDLLDSGL